MAKKKKNDIPTMPMFYNKHYITVDDNNFIVNGFSDAFRTPTENDICINEQGGYQFRLFSNGEENPPLMTMHGVPLYKWEDNAVVERPQEDIVAEEKAIEEQMANSLTPLEKLESQVTYTAMMTDTLLEEV